MEMELWDVILYLEWNIKEILEIGNWSEKARTHITGEIQTTHTEVVSCWIVDWKVKLQSVKILFNAILSYFLAKSYFVLFFGKCPILSYVLAILPLILVFYSLFITIISHKKFF